MFCHNGFKILFCAFATSGSFKRSSFSVTCGTLIESVSNHTGEDNKNLLRSIVSVLKLLYFLDPSACHPFFGPLNPKSFIFWRVVSLAMVSEKSKSSTCSSVKIETAQASLTGTLPSILGVR